MNHNKALIEDMVVHILLCNPELIITAPIESRWFIRNSHIIDAMLGLTGKGIAIDAFSVNASLMASKMALNGISDESFISQLIDLQRNAYGSHKNYKLYLDELKNATISSMVNKAVKTASKELDDGADHKDVISKLISDSMTLANDDGKDFVYDIRRGLVELSDYMTKTFEEKDTGGSGVKTGIIALDDDMGGLQPTDLVVIGARPGVGKTAFGLSVARNAMKAGKSVGFFSTEMSSLQLFQRLVALESGVNAKKIRHADLDDYDFARITLAQKNLLTYNLRVCDKAVITANEMSMMTRAWKSNGGLDLIVIDYLTRIKPEKSQHNKNIEVGETVTAIKSLAKMIETPVILLAQLNRSGASRANPRPVMTDLRDSGVIEQEADNILMLYRPEGESPEIIIEKNRHGSCGVVMCDFIQEVMEWRSKNVWN